MTAILLVKLILVPALIYLVTWVGNKWGPAVAGWLSAFPIVAGPILAVMTFEQGAQFGASAAKGTLLAVNAILVFSLVYAWASAKFAVLGSLLCSLSVYAIAVFALSLLQLPLATCLMLVLVMLLVAPALLPKLKFDLVAKRTPNTVLWRMLAGAVLVTTVTFFATAMGPRLSGLLAMFPVMGTVLVGFSHHYSGRNFVISMLRGMMFGYYAFACFCAILALLLARHSSIIAFGSALICAIFVQLAAKRWMPKIG
jgi:hypothetical protein